MKTIILMISILFFLCNTAIAGPFTDQMSKCIVTKTTDADKTMFIRWMYAAMSSHPDVGYMSNISPEMKDQLNKTAAKMMMELITVRCKEECKQAIKYEGENSFETAFGVLGEAAMQGLMSHPKVFEFISGLERYIDEDALKKSLAEE